MPPLVKARISSAEDVYHAHPQHPDFTPAETCLFRWWRHASGTQRGEMKGPMPTELALAPAAVAYVSAGRWVVDCPFLPCRSAQMASKGDRRFFCVECDNGGTGKWVPVTWPSDADVATVEALLSVRPLPATRSWLVGEPIEHLAAENTAGGPA